MAMRNVSRRATDDLWGLEAASPRPAGSVSDKGERSMHKKDSERGQSILIIAFIVLVLLALVALVVDVGNAYAHRRMVQNAVDAAALAGARMLAFRGSTEPLGRVRHIEVASAVYDYAEKNGLIQEDVRMWFILDDGTPADLHPQSHGFVDESVVGVGVEGDLPFDTYFAHLLGFPTMQATADSAAYQIWGPCSMDDCIFPIAIHESTFSEKGLVEGELYELWSDDQKWGEELSTPGSFGWIYWVDGENKMRGEPPQGPEVTSLEPNLDDPCRSNDWYCGEWVHGDVGVNFQPVLDMLERYIEDLDGKPVVIPFYDEVQKEGNNGLFKISGFGAFRLVCAHSSRAHFVGDCPDDANKDNRKYLTGIFEGLYVTGGFEDGCEDTGITGVSFRPPKNLFMPEWTEDD